MDKTSKMLAIEEANNNTPIEELMATKLQTKSQNALAKEWEIGKATMSLWVFKAGITVNHSVTVTAPEGP